MRESKWKILALGLLAVFVMAAGVPEQFATDLLKLGRPSSSDDKVIEINTGDGASNPKITVDMTNKDFDFNKALNIVETQLKLGKGVSEDLLMVFDVGAGASNPVFKWDSTAGALSFANDGVNFKKIGSGGGSGGGGINLLAESNFDFEAGTTVWGASGGTFALDTTTPLNGDASGTYDASAAAQTFSSAAIAVTEAFNGRTCTVDGLYRWPSGVQDDLTFEVYDGTSVIASVNPVPTTTETRPLNFPFFSCPSSGTLQFRITSNADAALIELDDIFLGVGRNTLSISQTELVAFAKYPATASCTWSVSSTTFADFPADTDCSPIQVDFATYEVDLTENDLPQISFSNLPAGTYLVEAVFDGFTDSNSSYGQFRFSDGSTSGPHSSNVQINPSVNSENIKAHAVFSYSTSGPRTFKLQGAMQGGGNFISIFNATTGEGGELSFKVTKFPKNASESVTLETVGSYVDVVISNGGVVNLATSGTTQQVPSDAGLQLYNYGTLTAKIGCDGGNLPTGVTCSAGNEVISPAFTPHIAGPWEVCTTFSQDVTLGSSGSIEASWQIIRRSANGITDLEVAGDVGRNTFQYNGSPSSLVHAQQQKLCGIFNLDISESRFDLSYTQNAAGTISINRLISGFSGGTAGFIRFTARPVNQSFPTPVFTDLQNSLNSKIESSADNHRIETATVNCSSSSTFTEDGNWVTSVSNISSGACTINFDPGVFSQSPKCTASRTSAFGSPTSFAVTGATTSSVVIDCAFSSSGSACLSIEYDLFCKGPK